MVQRASASFDIYRKRLDMLPPKSTPLLTSAAVGPHARREDRTDSLTRCLVRFARDHFDFVDTNYLLTRDEFQHEYSRENALQTILEQIDCDMEVIQRARDQSSPSTMASSVVASSRVFPSNPLDQADKLAMQALQPAKGLLDANTTVLTYQRKSPGIRIIPYAKVALIGIPMTCLSTERDLLAIPHEIGHYLYRNGKPSSSQGKRIQELVNDKAGWGTKWYHHWLEEIFADIYGCLIAGPVIALSCQDNQLEYSRTGFVADDGEHPMPAVRPYIYLRVLEKHGPWKNACDVLRGQWNQKWNERTDYQPGKPEKLFDTLDRIVDRIYDWLIDLGISIGSWPYAPEARQGAAELYSDFAERLRDPLINNTKIPQVVEVPEPWDDWMTAKGFPAEKRLREVLSKMSKKTWENLLLADGWVTKAQHKAISPDVRHPIT